MGFSFLRSGYTVIIDDFSFFSFYPIYSPPRSILSLFGLPSFSFSSCLSAVCTMYTMLSLLIQPPSESCHNFRYRKRSCFVTKRCYSFISSENPLNHVYWSLGVANIFSCPPKNVLGESISIPLRLIERLSYLKKMPTNLTGAWCPGVDDRASTCSSWIFVSQGFSVSEDSWVFSGVSAVACANGPKSPPMMGSRIPCPSCVLVGESPVFFVECFFVSFPLVGVVEPR